MTRRRALQEFDPHNRDFKIAAPSIRAHQCVTWFAIETIGLARYQRKPWII